MTQILSTIAFRANLLEACQKYCSNAKGIITKWSMFNDEVAKLPLESDLSELMLSARLSGTVTALETLLNDTLVDIYVAYPPKLGSKKLTIQELNTSGTYLQAVKNIANKAINEISYKSFKEYWEEWQKLVVNLEKVSEDQVNLFAEVKATRDLYVHNNGKLNDQYLRKAGKKARSKDLHGKIPIDLDYINSTSELAKAFISAIEGEITRKYSNCTKESVFREMWNATRCGELLNFDIQWELSKKPYHKKKYEWPWSSSEKALFDFFQTVFLQNSKDIDTDMYYALYRWSPETPEGKVMRSWLDSPFYI